MEDLDLVAVRAAAEKFQAVASDDGSTASEYIQSYNAYVETVGVSIVISLLDHIQRLEAGLERVSLISNNPEDAPTEDSHVPPISAVRGAYVHLTRRMLGLEQANSAFDRFISRIRTEAKSVALNEAYNYGLGRTGHHLHRWLRIRANQYKEGQ